MSDKFRSIAKSGWHPGKDKEKNPYDYGKNEKPKHGIRENFKGVNTVASFVGKGKPVDDYNASSHQSAPLSSLKDPAAFGPPPKRTGTSDFGDSQADSSAAPAVPSKPKYASAGGLGGSMGKQYGESPAERRERLAKEAEEEVELEAQRKAQPYRVDTTGLSTTGFAPPPKVRSDGFASHVAKAPVAPKPGLPPRLPPRGPAAVPASPPPHYEQSDSQGAPEQGILNPGAMNRLGQAGINVPALGVGSSTPMAPALPSRHQASSSTGSTSNADTVSELQARFGRMDTKRVSEASSVSSATSPIKKKPAPPPPPKKDILHSGTVGEQAPPVPVSSKPRW